MNEYRVVEDRYEGGQVWYRIQQGPQNSVWSDVITDYGPVRYTSLKKAKRAIARMYGERLVTSRVVWP